MKPGGNAEGADKIKLSVIIHQLRGKTLADVASPGIFDQKTVRNLMVRTDKLSFIPGKVFIFFDNAHWDRIGAIIEDQPDMAI